MEFSHVSGKHSAAAAPDGIEDKQIAVVAPYRMRIKSEVSHTLCLDLYSGQDIFGVVFQVKNPDGRGVVPGGKRFVQIAISGTPASVDVDTGMTAADIAADGSETAPVDVHLTEAHTFAVYIEIHGETGRVIFPVGMVTVLIPLCGGN